MRVKTNFVSEDTGVSSGPLLTSVPTSPRKPEVSDDDSDDDAGEEAETTATPKPSTGVISSSYNHNNSNNANEEESSSDWSTDSGDMNPYLSTTNRRLSPSSSLLEENQEGAVAPVTSKKAELLNSLQGVGRERKHVRFQGGDENADSSEQDQEQQRRRREQDGANESQPKQPQEEKVEEEEERVITVRPKKKKGKDPLHMELQARLGLKPTTAPLPQVEQAADPASEDSLAEKGEHTNTQKVEGE